MKYLLKPLVSSIQPKMNLFLITLITVSEETLGQQYEPQKHGLVHNVIISDVILVDHFGKLH